MLRVVAFCLDQILYDAFLNPVSTSVSTQGQTQGALKQNSLRNSVNRKAFSPLLPQGHVEAALSQNTMSMFIRCCF